MSFINTLVLKIWAWYKGHEGVTDAHHTKYTDTEAVDAVNTDDKYIKRDGSKTLTADWDIGDGRKIEGDEIRARDAAGLKLYEDSGKGIFVEDGGYVGIGTNNPNQLLKVEGSGSIYMASKTTTNSSCGLIFANTSRGWAQKVNVNGAWILRDITGGNDRMVIDTSGRIKIGSGNATALLDINSDVVRLRTSKTPASAGATGNQGDICWDVNYIYVCTATNTWKRTSIATW